MPITRTCRISGKDFVITDQEIALLDKLSPIIGWEKFPLPLPTLCPEERLRRRLSWRNTYSIYKSTCSVSHTSIVSLYHPLYSGKVVEQKIWWSDAIDNTSSWSIYDPDRSFFSQFKSLLQNTTLPCLTNEYTSTENSEYVNSCNDVHNSYLIFSASDADNCGYSEGIKHCSSCFDCYFTRNSEHCYECIGIENCHDCTFLEESSNCSGCQYSYNLKGCSFCFLSYDLENKKYCIRNQEYPDETSYKKALRALYPDLNHETIRRAFAEMKLRDSIGKKIIQNSESCSGNHIHNSKNVLEGYDIVDAEDSAYIWWLMWDVRDCYDCFSYWSWLHRSYQTWGSGGNSSHLIWCQTVWQESHDVYYSFFCYNCQYCFGCIGLKGKQYCIFNTQYTKEAYTILVREIIHNMIQENKWWEFLESSIAPHGYNETMANLYFPLTKEEALRMWYRWSDYEAPRPEAQRYIPAERIPEDISSIPDDILDWAIECEVSGKYYKITRPELEFYRKHHLPIPKKHYDVRRKERFERRIP